MREVSTRRSASVPGVVIQITLIIVDHSHYDFLGEDHDLLRWGHDFLSQQSLKLISFSRRNKNSILLLFLSYFPLVKPWRLSHRMILLNQFISNELVEPIQSGHSEGNDWTSWTSSHQMKRLNQFNQFTLDKPVESVQSVQIRWNRWTNSHQMKTMNHFAWDDKRFWRWKVNEFTILMECLNVRSILWALWHQYWICQVKDW
jgi:hypothetical protein